jgi:hypothetical protein
MSEDKQKEIAMFITTTIQTVEADRTWIEDVLLDAMAKAGARVGGVDAFKNDTALGHLIHATAVLRGITQKVYENFPGGDMPPTLIVINLEPGGMTAGANVFFIPALANPDSGIRRYARHVMVPKVIKQHNGVAAVMAIEAYAASVDASDKKDLSTGEIIQRALGEHTSVKDMEDASEIYMITMATERTELDMIIGIDANPKRLLDDEESVLILANRLEGGVSHPESGLALDIVKDPTGNITATQKKETIWFDDDTDLSDLEEEALFTDMATKRH